jgi:trans-aconitate methyltransferase
MNKEYWESRYLENKEKGKVGLMDWKSDDILQEEKEIFNIISAFYKEKKVECGTILDYGCGIGSKIKYIYETFKPLKYIGIDFSDVAIIEAKKRRPDFDFRTGTVNLYDKANIIFMAYVVQHMEDRDIINTLKLLSDNLEISGKIYIISNTTDAPDKPYIKFRNVEEHRMLFKMAGYDSWHVDSGHVYNETVSFFLLWRKP